MADFLANKAGFERLKKAVQGGQSFAAESDDIVVQALDLSVSEVQYVEPNTLTFRGSDNRGQNRVVIISDGRPFSARVIIRGKQGNHPLLTRFVDGSKS